MTDESILIRITKYLQRSYPLPDKYFLPEDDWLKLREEMKEYCKYNNVVGPLSADIPFVNILVMGVPIVIQEKL